MLNTSLDSSFIDRLKQILASRYGKGLQIRQLMDISEMDLEQEIFARGRDLHIPLRVNGHFLGTAVVPSADDLDSEKRQGVAQLVRMVLEPAMYRWYLEQKENNLIEISKAVPNLEKIQLFGEELPPITDDLIEDELMEPSTSQLVTSIIHLEGRFDTTNKKVALHLHELTSRWAFVPFNDIKGQLHSAHDIAKMGEMTIFIEKLEDLNPSEQELLMEYLCEEHIAEEPLIVTSSKLSLEELAKLENMSPLLLDEVAVNTFEVDKAPMTSQGLKDVLELFFLKDQSLHS
jgi:hypothetical protein